MKFFEKIFSIKNDKSYHKVICILGIKIKTKNKYALLQNEIINLKNEIHQVDNVNEKRIQKIIPHKKIETVELHIVEHCNLNCKGCGHFAPLAKEEFLNLEEFKRDILRLSELTQGRLKQLVLLGGEPLLHPNCIDFCIEARKIFPNSIIRLVTNGLLLESQQKKIFENCSTYNILISSTKYPIDKINWANIEELLDKNNVKFEFYQGSGDNEKQFIKQITDINGLQNPKESFINCRHDDRSWFYLQHGFLYHCWVIPYSRHFEQYFNIKFERSKNDGINIHDAKDEQEILEFLSKPTEFCKYCKPKESKELNKWDYSKQSISEWTDLSETQCLQGE